MVDLTDPENRDLEDLAKVFCYFGEVETPKLNSNVYTSYTLGVAWKTRGAHRSPLSDDFVAEALYPVDLFLQLHRVGLVGVAITDR
jgi:hypothetical protein